MKTDLQEKFFHENIFNALYLIDNKKIKMSDVKEKYCAVIGLLNSFYIVYRFMEKHFNIKIDGPLDLNFFQTLMVKEYIEKTILSLDSIPENYVYMNIIKNLHEVSYFKRVMLFSSMLNCTMDKVNNSGCFVFSSNVTKVLLELGDITGKCIYNPKSRLNINEENAKYFFYNNYQSKYIDELHIYTYERLDEDDYLDEMYAIVFKLKQCNTYGLLLVEIEKYTDGGVSNYHTAINVDIDINIFETDDRDEIEKILNQEMEKLIRLTYASNVFIVDQPKLIQKKINEFSSKRKKREYQLKKYTESEFNFVDIPYTHVKAYSDKTWSSKSTYGIRWCGPGRKRAEIRFIKGCPNKSWKNKIKGKK